MALSMTPSGYLPTRHPKRQDLLSVVRALLRYSFEPISYDFDALTERERIIVGSPAQLARIRQFATEERGIERDNCSACEGTGQRIDFAAIRARNAE